MYVGGSNDQGEPTIAAYKPNWTQGQLDHKMFRSARHSLEYKGQKYVNTII